MLLHQAAHKQCCCSGEIENEAGQGKNILDIFLNRVFIYNTELRDFMVSSGANTSS